MRLQLIFGHTALLGCTLVATAAAEVPAATATVRFYADDDHVTVVSPAAAARAPLGALTSVAVDAVVDIVSAASVDVLTSASPAAVHEVRTEVGAVVTRRVPWGAATTVAASARGSTERDFLFLGASLGAHAEFAERNTTLEVRYELERDTVGSSVDPSFSRRRHGHRLAATLTQLLDDHTVVDLIADGTATSGYQASPYRRIALERPGWPSAIYVDEVTPTARVSLAVAARLRRELRSTWFATATYRYCFDDWALVSHTAAAEVRHRIGDRWLLGIALRGYQQRGASFYRGSYQLTPQAVAPSLRTRDRTLGPMRDLAASVTIDRTLGTTERWHVVAAVGAIAWWYFDDPAQAHRRAVTSTLSVSASLE